MIAPKKDGVHRTHFQITPLSPKSNSLPSCQFPMYTITPAVSQALLALLYCTSFISRFTT